MRIRILPILLLAATACTTNATSTDDPAADDDRSEASEATPTPPAPSRPLELEAHGPPFARSRADADANACGCSLCQPVFSDDACATDADCAPATACHAPACVAKSKAEPPRPGVQCTDVFACSTADANACGCVQGRCALYPRPEGR